MFFSTEGTVRIKTVRDSIWCTPIILTLERLRIVNSRPVWMRRKFYNSLSYRARLCEKEKERLGKKRMKE